jgi:O-antigen ligase
MPEAPNAMPVLPTIDTPARWSVRLGLVCLTALSVSLPMAWISLAKFLLFTSGVVYLIAGHWTRRGNAALNQLWTTRVLLVILVVFGFSVFWSEADTATALSGYVKHAKLMGILLLLSLVRSEWEARIAVLAFAAGQVFLLLSSWMMFLGIPIPWSADAPTPYVVFSSYLDQSIMLATSAGIFWHLRKERLWPQWAGLSMALLALVNALLLLEGRTGYLVALTTLSLAAMWAMPKRLRTATLIVTPAIALLALSLGSAQVHERVTKIVSESLNFTKHQQVGVNDSTGWRLNAWRRSVQAINEKPLAGHGVGGWTPAAKRFEGSNANALFGEGNNSNPHQEYLLWGVELGLGGVLLLVAFLLAAARDAFTFAPGIGRATLSVLAAITVACLFNSSLYDDLMGDYLCVSLGVLLALGAQSRHLNTAKQAPVQTVGVAQGPA